MAVILLQHLIDAVAGHPIQQHIVQLLVRFLGAFNISQGGSLTNLPGLLLQSLQLA